MKSIDIQMRRQYGFKSSLKDVQTTKLFLDTINQEIEKVLIQKKKNDRPKIEIDFSKLQEIRETALETQSKLIVENEAARSEPRQEQLPLEAALQEPAVPEQSGIAGEAERESNLNETESQLLYCLLYKKPYNDFLNSEGLMLSVLIDAINEKLFDLFSDTVIAYDGDRPELIEDYIEELKGIIKE